MRLPRFRRLHLLPLACLFAGTSLTVLLSLRARRDEAARLDEALRRASLPVATAIQRVLDQHVEVVQSVAGLFYASDQVTTEEFREFTRRLLASHPSIQALAWAPRVRQAEREAFEEGVRARGLAGFEIRQMAADGVLEPAAPRKEFFPVTLVEPLEWNHGPRRG
jgi:CHASE1-domain containing sensor protein